MDEFAIIRRFFTPENKGDSVIVGVGDDGAVLRPSPGRDLVSVVDTLVSGVHYPPHMLPGDVGFRAVAVNASDIAAMGARPRWMTLAVTMDAAYQGWVEDFAGGIAHAASTFNIELVGGDLTRGGENVVSVQITGDVEPGTAITRSGAKPGDSIYVSGTPGDAALGLSLMQSGGDLDPRLDYLIRRFTQPTARVELGQAIGPHASAAIDVSDGLYTDLEKLLAASQVAGCIELNDVPLSQELRETVAFDDALRFALGGGDDYELCFTVPAELFGGSAEIAGVKVTRIGYVNEGEGLTCTMDGQLHEYRDAGYRHFQ